MLIKQKNGRDMKKSIYAILAAGAVVLAMAACSKEQDTQEGNTGVITESLLAEKESDLTKITLDGSTMKFGWSAGNDKASFTILNGSTYSFVDSDFYGATTPGKFTVSYTGTRQGYAVTPASFKGSYDGTNLVVNYPTSYDITKMVDAGCYDNADGNHYIRFPMVAQSVSGSDVLAFRSIGALAKVTVAQVPAGTKKLYITFNKKVTGDFTVTNPDSNAPYVTATDGTSTVEVKISNDGLTARKDITLYIPVPTATGLSISASTVTKPTVARNQGYAWSVNAISRVSNATDFSINGTNYILAPGNLYARRASDNSKYEWYNRTAIEQVVTTLGAMNDDPHLDDKILLEIENTPGIYRDVFTWDRLYHKFNGIDPTGAAGEVIDGTITLEDGTVWQMLTRQTAEALFSGTGRDNKASIEVKGINGAPGAKARIELDGSTYEGYAQYTDSDTGKKVVYGCFLFPDGYVDMTDLMQPIANMSEIYAYPTNVSFDAYAQMVNAGAIFLVNGGFADNNRLLGSCGNRHIAYHLGTSSVDDKCDGTTGSEIGYCYVQTTVSRNYYRSVRLCRVANP